MKHKQKIIVGAVVIVLIVAAGYLLTRHEAKAPQVQTQPAQFPLPQQTQDQTPVATPVVTPQTQTQIRQNAGGSDYTPPDSHFSGEGDIQPPPQNQ